MPNTKELIDTVFGAGRSDSHECPNCGSVLNEHEIKDEIVLGDGESIQARIPVLSCSSCDFVLMADGAEEIRDAAIRMHRKLLTADQIRAIRENLGFSRREFSEAFGIAPASMERWENGRLVQSESNDTLLRALSNKGSASALDRRRIGQTIGGGADVIQLRALKRDSNSYADAISRSHKFSLRSM